MASPKHSQSSALTPSQHQAIAPLASGKYLSATARELGVHRATLHNWFHNPDFSDTYKEASRAAAEAISDEMHSLSRLALLRDPAFLAQQAPQMLDKRHVGQTSRSVQAHPSILLDTL